MKVFKCIHLLKRIHGEALKICPKSDLMNRNTFFIGANID